MSRQIGLIKVKGNLDGVSFYQSNGENFVRMAKGPDKKRIMTDPAFKRTRENNSEFTGSAVAAKAFRDAMLPALKAADNRLTSRTLKLVRTIHGNSSGIRGQRNIEISLNKAMLENLDLNEAAKFTSIFKHQVDVEPSADRLSGKLTIPNFELSEGFTPPQEATHCRFMYVMGSVSDFTFNKNTNRFEPVQPKLSGLYGVKYTDYIDVSSMEIQSITLEAALKTTEELPAEISVVHAVGVLFYKQTANVFYILKQANACKVARIV